MLCQPTCIKNRTSCKNENQHAAKRSKRKAFLSTSKMVGLLSGIGRPLCLGCKGATAARVFVMWSTLFNCRSRNTCGGGEFGCRNCALCERFEVYNKTSGIKTLITEARICMGTGPVITSFAGPQSSFFVKMEMSLAKAESKDGGSSWGLRFFQIPGGCVFQIPGGCVFQIPRAAFVSFDWTRSLITFLVLVTI